MKYLAPFLEKNTFSTLELPTKPTKPINGVIISQVSISDEPTKPTKPTGLRVAQYDPDDALRRFLAEHPKLKPKPAEMEELRAEYFNKPPDPTAALTCDRCMPIKRTVKASGGKCNHVNGGIR